MKCVFFFFPTITLSPFILPNLFIFGGLLMAMLFFPGWKEPFSNTIGYLILTTMGIKETFINILKTDSQNKLLKMVTDDPSIMINEMTPENFDLFVARMGGKNGGVDSLPVAEAKPIDSPPPSAPPLKGGRRKQRGGNSSILSADYKNHLPGLYGFVVIKDMVSEFLWYILVGNLVINTSNSYIQTIKCNRSASDLGAFVESSLNNPKKEKKKEKWSLGY